MVKADGSAGRRDGAVEASAAFDGASVGATVRTRGEVLLPFTIGGMVLSVVCSLAAYP